MAPLLKTDPLMRNLLAIRDALGVEVVTVARQHIEKAAPKRCQAQCYFSQGDLTGRQAIVAFIKAYQDAPIDQRRMKLLPTKLRERQNYILAAEFQEGGNPRLQGSLKVTLL